MRDKCMKEITSKTKCLLLDVEMPIGKVCPSVYNLDGFLCYEGCGFADDPKFPELVEDCKKSEADDEK